MMWLKWAFVFSAAAVAGWHQSINGAIAVMCVGAMVAAMEELRHSVELMLFVLVRGHDDESGETP